MREQDWAACNDPEVMLKFLVGKTPREVLRSAPGTRPGRVSDRALRLFACACARRVPPAEVASPPVDVAERFADGLAPPTELAKACADAYVASAVALNLRRGRPGTQLAAPNPAVALQLAVQVTNPSAAVAAWHVSSTVREGTAGRGGGPGGAAPRRRRAPPVAGRHL